MRDGEAAFWEYVAKKNMHIQHCPECATWVYPPSPVCPGCLHSPLRWLPVGGGGTVWSYTIYRHSFADHLRERVPYTLALVELDEGPLMMGNLPGDEHDLDVIGTRVRVAYGEVAQEATYWFAPLDQERIGDPRI